MPGANKKLTPSIKGLITQYLLPDDKCKIVKTKAPI